jgi:hypothetical protein
MAAAVSLMKWIKKKPPRKLASMLHKRPVESRLPQKRKPVVSKLRKKRKTAVFRPKKRHACKRPKKICNVNSNSSYNSSSNNSSSSNKF